MRPQIALIQAQALAASFLAERVAGRIAESQKSAWLDRRRSAAQDAPRHHRRVAERDLRLASIGMVAATGGALAGGPAALGTVVFLAGAAAAGKAIFHLTSAKLAEIRAATHTRHAHGAPLSQAERQQLLAETQAMTRAVFDEVQNELVADLLAAAPQLEQPGRAAAATTKVKP